MNTQKQITLIVALFFILVGGCAAYTVVDLPVRAEDQIKWHEDQSVERGALLFANNCRTCHGLKGEGGVGPTLNRPEFKDQDPLILKNNRALLTRTISCGHAGTRMPAWLNTNGGSLNVRQVEHLVNLITAPVSEKYIDEDTEEPTSRGWFEAVEFGHNLNHETVAVVGGDTLSTIAKDHGVGIAELVALNGNRDPQSVIKKGTKIKLPVSKGRPEGGTYKVNKDRETLAKIADNHHVGSMIIADLNNIPYTIAEKTQTFKLKDGEKNRVAGLIPGAKLVLPAGATYIVKASDTVDSIAQQHGVRASDITSLNKDLPTTADGKLDAERKLKLPNNPVAVVQAGQTFAAIAAAHGLTSEELLASSGLQAEPAQLGAGQQLKLPANATYTIQTGDTLASVAAGHGITADALAGLNSLKPGDAISPAVIIALPKVDGYVVKGQNLEEIAATYSNVTAKSLAEAQEPKAQENSIYAIGTQLKLPEDAWGSAPPDAINNGTACLQYTVNDEVYKGVLGVGETPPPPPTTTTRTLLIEAHANDWQFTADGTKQDPNKGVALVAKGTTVTFQNVVGVHTITTKNGTAPKKVEVASFKGTDKFELTFNDAGTFAILCDIHPAMKGTVYVQ